MSKSIVIFGAGPGLGKAVAHRYASEGYKVLLVARRLEPLKQLAEEVSFGGASIHAISADLSNTGAVASLADEIRSKIGNPDVLYYGPTAGGPTPATSLTPQHLQALMPTALYTLVALVREFLPYMIEQRDGAILVATGASAVQGIPNLSGPGPCLAAQRNYLQSLQAELTDKNVYVGRLYIGTTIKHSAWHSKIEAEKAADTSSWTRGPVVDPSHLADLLWTMHNVTKSPESIYPEDIFKR